MKVDAPYDRMRSGGVQAYMQWLVENFPENEDGKIDVKNLHCNKNTFSSMLDCLFEHYGLTRGDDRTVELCMFMVSSGPSGFYPEVPTGKLEWVG